MPPQVRVQAGGEGLREFLGGEPLRGEVHDSGDVRQDPSLPQGYRGEGGGRRALLQEMWGTFRKGGLQDVRAVEGLKVNKMNTAYYC